MREESIRPSFTSDPSFLPDLRAHLYELLRARERGQAMGANDWALVPMEEITRLRGLIRSLETDLATRLVSGSSGVLPAVDGGFCEQQSQGTGQDHQPAAPPRSA